MFQNAKKQNKTSCVMDQRTDRPTDQPTDRVTHRVACKRKEIEGKLRKFIEMAQCLQPCFSCDRWKKGQIGADGRWRGLTGADGRRQAQTVVIRDSKLNEK